MRLVRLNGYDFIIFNFFSTQLAMKNIISSRFISKSPCSIGLCSNAAKKSFPTVN